MAIERREEAAAQAIVTPAEADRVLEMIKAFEYFKSNVLTVRDVVAIQGKPFVKKSGWSKYALACNVSTELRDERVEERDGHRIYHFTYRAVHLPSGRYAEAVGSASEAERREWNHPEHDVRTLAQTRAFNRSISNLVGGGEVSAEEMEPQPRRRRVRSEPVRRSSTAATTTPPFEVEKPRPPAPGLRPGKVSPSIVEYNLHAAGVDAQAVDIVEQADWFHVEPRGKLDDEDWYKINSILEDLGGVWEQRGLLGRWVIKKEG